ncbi:hypothetical protein DPMN_091796 [Dreissena polymorpha]|uniref:Uncharacterized protein n=1 Tax=Dreissena polymorpha TaxID=45954 RepID=A0A9D4L055_DREPO|nr:hypothetical protein DPMN_091796 [Dreissena polymorpha]
MNMMFMSLNERFDTLEASLEQRIANRVSLAVDKRMNSEINRVRKKIDSKMDSKFDSLQQSVKAEIAADLASLRNEVKSFKGASSLHRSDSNSQSQSHVDRSMNIVIRNLPESASESTQSKVNALLKDGLKVSHVTVGKVERKQSYNESKPGVIIVTLNSKEDKQAIMKANTVLRQNSQYKNVFIHHDQLPSERSTNKNFATILNALKSSQGNLYMKGSRVVYSDVDIDSSRKSDFLLQNAAGNRIGLTTVIHAEGLMR